jgi:radical SAM superfamily enzyme YgiQ (UPF0313 family)
MKLTIINPPSLFLTDDRVNVSLGPLQAAAIARDLAGWTVSVLDLSGHCADTDPNLVWREAARGVEVSDADVFGVYVMSCHLEVAARICEVIRSVRPKAIILAGGPHGLLRPDDLHRAGFSSVVVGAGCGGGARESLLAALSDLENLHELQAVYRVPSRALETPEPWADRGLVDQDQYHCLVNGERATGLITQYGCPYSCGFCCHAEGYRSVLQRPLEHVRGELIELRERWGFQVVNIHDDEMNLDGRRVGGRFDRLCETLSGEEFRWRGLIRTNLFDARQADKAQRHGAVLLAAGVETADEDLKRCINKRTSVADDERFVSLCLDAGITPKLLMIFGLPGETRRTAERMLSWLSKQVERGAQFDLSLFVPYPGSPIHDHMEKYLIRWVESPGEVFGPYKRRPGEYSTNLETLNPDGTVALTSDQLVWWHDHIEQTVRSLEKSRSNV